MTTVVMQNKFSLSDLKNVNESKEKYLMMLVCGPRGVGKSSFIGTSKLPTLFITSYVEKHNVEAATTLSDKPDNIVSIYCDKNGETRLDERQSYDRLLEILDWAIHDQDVRKNIDVIGFDGLSVADWMIQKHPSVVNATSFDKSKITQILYMNILKKIIELNDNFHIICTMPASYSYDPDGSINSAKIDLTGLAVSNIVTGIFPQIFPIVQIDKKSMISMEVGITKSGKSMSGENKSISFYPRMTGFKEEEVNFITRNKNILKADASYILKLYKMKQNGELDKYFNKEKVINENHRGE